MTFSKLGIWTFSLIFWVIYGGMHTTLKSTLLRLEGQSVEWFSVALRPFCESLVWFFLTPLLWHLVFRWGLKPNLAILQNLGRGTFLFIGGIVLTYFANVFTVGLIFLSRDLPLESFDPFSARWGLHLLREPVPWLFLLVTTLLHLFSWSKLFANQKTELLETKLKWEKLQQQNLMWVLQPHLLFNSLQSMIIDAENQGLSKAPLEDLSNYFHTVFEGSQKDEVDLENELSYLAAFLRLANSEKRVAMDIQASENSQILAFSLQCLVENALKYGQGTVLLRIFTSSNQLVVEVSNEISTHTQHPGWGLGLQNLKDRIQLLYGNSGSFLFSVYEETANAYMKIPQKDM